MVLLLADGGVHQRLMGVQNGLGEARGAGGEVDGRVVVLRELHSGGTAGAELHQPVVAVGEGGHVLAHVEEGLHPGEPGEGGGHPLRELRPEHQHGNLGEVRAVGDLLVGVPVVHGHGQGPGLQNAEVDGQPFEAVHEEDPHLVPLLHVPGEQEVREPVGLGVELPPGHVPAIAALGAGLDEGILPPGHLRGGAGGGVDFHQSHLVGEEFGVLFQCFRNQFHGFSFFVKFNI